MARMVKAPIRQQKTTTFRYFPASIALPLGVFLIVGGCTFLSSTPSSDGPSLPQSRGTDTNLSIKKESPSRTAVSSDHPAVIETPPVISQTAEGLETKGMLAKGRLLYGEYCAKCHGIDGNGKGPLAADLSTKPQNFTKGEYKFRSTMSGELPTDADLFRTITVGIPGTAMESYQDLPEPDRMALVTYLKSLSPRFLKSPPGTPIIFPVTRPNTPESVARGRQLYENMQCSACHGEEGRGDGELAQELTDTAGDPIQPADLTRRRLKSGQGPGAIYRTVMTGLDGTPMPSYGYSLDPEEGWALALYIFSLVNVKEPQ